MSHNRESKGDAAEKQRPILIELEDEEELFSDTSTVAKIPESSDNAKVPEPSNKRTAASPEDHSTTLPPEPVPRDPQTSKVVTQFRLTAAPQRLSANDVDLWYHWHQRHQFSCQSLLTGIAKCRQKLAALASQVTPTSNCDPGLAGLERTLERLALEVRSVARQWQGWALEFEQLLQQHLAAPARYDLLPVSCGGRQFMLPATAVQAVTPLGPDSLQELCPGNTYITVAGQSVPFVALAELLQLANERCDPMLALVINSEAPWALGVEQVQSVCRVFTKPVPSDWDASLPLAGMAFTCEGQPLLILEISKLNRLRQAQPQKSLAPEKSPQSFKTQDST